MDHKFVAIEGVIGVGKTTLARLLAPSFNAGLLLEVFEENPFLPMFYGDRERYAFQTQIFFLLSRYHQQRRAVPAALRDGMLISDYTFAKDEIFAWLNLKDDELAMYGRVHAALAEKLPRPSLIVFLRASHEVLMRRIALRDRPYERDMDPGYIRDVAAAYDAWLTHLDGIPVLTIDTDEIDFLSRETDLHQIADRVRASLEAGADEDRERDTPRRPLARATLGEHQAARRALVGQAESNEDAVAELLHLTQAVGALAGLAAGGEAAGTSDKTDPGGARFDAARWAVQLATLQEGLLNLANATGVNLEAAYLERARQRAERDPTAG